jgi:L-fuculose-phosphate aldolase
MLERERGRVARASRHLALEGLVLGTAGNVSVRAGELVAVSPTGAQLGQVTPDQVTIVDLDGHHRHGPFAATSELQLHLEIYRRYDAGAVIHTHSRFATSLACVLDELPVVHYGLLALGGPIRVAPYFTFGTPELAAAAGAALEGRTAALMANHGTIAYGADVDVALEHTRLLEWVCEVYWRAAAIGPPRILDQAQCDAVNQTIAERAYGQPQRVTAPAEPQEAR